MSEDRVTCIVPYCTECGALDPIVSVPVEGGGEWRCVSCGFRFGVWLDGGELDIGVVPPGDTSVQFFTEDWD